jgi:hypothetical protein
MLLSMDRRNKSTDRLGVALLLGALIGFVIGGVIGFSSASLDAPVVLPFAGAAAGVLVTGLIAGIVAWVSRGDDGEREAKARDRDHAQFRQEARQGWVDGIDLASDPPPRPPRRQPRL